MTHVKITSFQELTLELMRQADGSTRATMVETKRIDIETTSAIFANLMPSDSLNPEQEILEAEALAGRTWDEDFSIGGTRIEFIARALRKAYS